MKAIQSWRRAVGIMCGAAAMMSSVAMAQVVRESFDYVAAENLTGLTGGEWWQAGWTQNGASAVIREEGLSYTDTIGNVLTASGLSMSTQGTATTRNFRVLAGGLFTDGWISFLYHLPASNRKFEGVNFLRGTAEVFSVSNPSTTTGSRIYLTYNPNGTAVASPQGQFGVTHLVVLKLTKGGGANGGDRVELFVDPLLTGVPSSPSATIQASRLDFDTIRIAGQDGSPLYIDEIRMGSTFGEVTPHVAAGELDSDGDGLTDAQEAVLGLNPNVSDFLLLQAIRQNPSWVGLYDAAGIYEMAGDGVIYQGSEGEAVPFYVEIQQSMDLNQWSTRRIVAREFVLPAGKQFLRVQLQENR